MGVSVESDQDCAAKEGVERAAKLHLVSKVNENPPQSSETLDSDNNAVGGIVGVYDGDGKRLGAFLGMEGFYYNGLPTDDAVWYYADNSRGYRIASVLPPKEVRTLYFTSEDCSGTAYSGFETKLGYATRYPNMSLIKTDRRPSRLTTRSNSSGEGHCSPQVRERDLFRILEEPAVHIPCGTYFCTLREE